MGRTRELRDRVLHIADALRSQSVDNNRNLASALLSSWNELRRLDNATNASWLEGTFALDIVKSCITHRELYGQEADIGNSDDSDEFMLEKSRTHPGCQEHLMCRSL